MCIGQGCTNKKPITLGLKTATVVIAPNFSSQSINEQVLVCTKLSPKDLNRKDLKAWIGKNTITVSKKKEVVLLGSYRQFPEAWFYVQIINPNNLNQNLVVDEFNHIRCDAFELVTFKNGIIKNWGSITRYTTFSDHPIPFFTYAIPFSIAPKDTLNLLIHTQRKNGVHEVNLSISTYKTYLSEHIYHFLSKIFQIFIFVIFILLMFVLGRTFRYKTMTYLGFYLISLLFVLLSSWGFIDIAVNFTSIGLSGSSVSTFSIFVSVVFFHLFCIELMKIIPKNEKRFNAINYSLIGINLLIACCYFLPLQLFRKIEILIPITMIFFSLLAIIWGFFWSLIALFRAKIYPIILGFGIAFLPYVVQLFSGFFQKNPVFLSRLNQPTFIFTAIGFTIISIYLLRGQLISRKKHEENLAEMKESVEEIRKKEIGAIGRNLHDQVGNTLASALGYLSMKELQPETVKDLIFVAINELRMISHNLVKDDHRVLSEKVASLTDRLNDFATTSFIFNDFSKQKIDRLPQLTQQNIYAIIQELLTNVLKHAQAQEVQVQFFDTEGILRIIVEDDGIGFDTQNEGNGIGLQNINQRVALIRGKLIIDSTPQGTTTIIDLTP